MPVDNAMTFVLLYFLTFATVLVMFASAITLVVWAFVKVLDTLVAIYLMIRQPELAPRQKRLRDVDLNQLKRAGQ
jgi:hypothetical protein